MTNVYLDWNIINQIEKDNIPVYQDIKKAIKEKRIITPYSNAHINDLIRGYEKNPVYIPGHLSIIKEITNNLCIVQYWGERNVKWHYRDVNEFFNSALEDVETSPKSYKELFNGFDSIADASSLWELQLSLLKSQILPDTFKTAFKNPTFSKMFPKAKLEMTMLALHEDIFNFSYNAKKDYTLYKTIRNFVNQNRTKLKDQKEMFRNVDKSMAGIPTHLNFDDQWELYSDKTKITDNPIYQKITGNYQKIDFRGIKSDERFANLIDDSLHVFYGAYCEYFITIDNNCHYKAMETYKELKIETKVMKPEEFIKSL